jgi:hypothetical protein
MQLDSPWARQGRLSSVWLCFDGAKVVVLLTAIPCGHSCTAGVTGTVRAHFAQRQVECLLDQEQRDRGAAAASQQICTALVAVLVLVFIEFNT